MWDSQDTARKLDLHCRRSTKKGNSKHQELIPFFEGEINGNPDNFLLSFSPTSLQQTLKAMSKLKNSKSFGLGRISSHFLKIGMTVLASSLSQILNLSMPQGLFPGSWKMARVENVYKIGSTNDQWNYRPISVLPVVERLSNRSVSTSYTLTITIFLTYLSSLVLDICIQHRYAYYSARMTDIRTNTEAISHQ